MEKVSIIQGAGAALLQPNIDTEVIISVERVMTFKRGEFGPYCLEPLRFRSDGSENPGFVLNQPRYRAATILIAGENFGCGSSREAAVWSLFDRGIRCIISPSFGDIFYTNCLQNGLLPIVMPIEEVQRLAAELAESANPAMTVDLVAQRITSASGRIVPFEIDARKRTALLGGLDEISQTLKLAPIVSAFQARDRGLHPWIYAGVARRAARVLLLAGDGIGPEIMGEVRRVIEWFISRRGLDLDLREELYGVSSWHAHGAVVRDQAWTEIRAADAILFGVAGSPQYIKIPREQWPPENMLRIHKELELFANLRPVKISRRPNETSLQRPEAAPGADLLMVRGLVGGADAGTPRGPEIERIARVAFEMARVRRSCVCSVDEASVAQTTVRWREVVQAMHDAEFPDVDLQHMHADAAATQLAGAPRQFDVLLIENRSGDVLSAGDMLLAGDRLPRCADITEDSIGMLPCASLGIAEADGRRRGLYQSIHGGAPDLVGKGVANPIGAILSFGMCLQFSIGLPMTLGAEDFPSDRALEPALRGSFAH